ncbi:DUF3472 domain-containing protein [Paludisphaera mucosa]|uniref:DUF3472 domain-containing protein n=1 Tax=Paludisphaera mucosa TaxID=3030827 RepID=A0ABT6FB49_9BACT|nr:DUF3472 domain-containing protein [Paludisphaera mucosa]MDG3004818.1 DUF3472 domain-containing protein [Paludisphaera mucosa]
MTKDGFRAALVAGLATIAMAAGAGAGADEKLKDIACRSVHLGYPGEAGTAFYNEITIRESAVGTYFMVCGWDKGYFGLQELGNGKKLLIFSVWDSESDDPNAQKAEARTRLVDKDEKTRVKRFGGEGSGGQSFYDYDWKLDETYKLMVSSRVDGQRTEYTGWFFVPEEKGWRKLVTFSTVTGGKDLGGYYAFIEDFRRDRDSTTHARRAEFADAWLRTTSGAAVPLTRARFTADRNPVMNIDAFAKDGRFTLVTGGATRNEGAELREVMELPTAGAAVAPEALKLAGPARP